MPIVVFSLWYKPISFINAIRNVLSAAQKIAHAGEYGQYFVLLCW